MKETPLICTTVLAAAIVAGRKTETRRLPKSLMARTRTAIRTVFIKSKALVVPANTLGPTKFNKHYAASIYHGESWVGLKPDEFNLTCRYSDGQTYLHDGRWHVDPNGSTLWLREVWKPLHDSWEIEYSDGTKKQCGFNEIDWFNADLKKRNPHRKRSPIHMPRWASRATLAIKSIHLERLGEIDNQDAIYEGVLEETFQLLERAPGTPQPRELFPLLWDIVHGEGSWNPETLVWVLKFKLKKS